MTSPSSAFEYFQPLPEAPPIPENNRQNKSKVELGRTLFLDFRLSWSGNHSCNTCHNLYSGGDDDTARSTGANNKLTRRSAPTLWNIGFQTVLNWDGRYKSLEAQAAHHLLNPSIMAIPSQRMLLQRLESIQQYQYLFSRAFDDDEPFTFNNLTRALASFLRTLTTPNSPFDQYMRGNHQALTAAALRGMQAFKEVGCLACHFGVNFAGPAPGPALKMGEGFYELFPNTLGSVYDKRYNLLDDLGRFEFSKDPGERYMWRVPPLRNIALTGPYFHNGSVSTLAESIRVMAKTQLERDLSDAVVADITAFLHSLTGQNPMLPSEY